MPEPIKLKVCGITQVEQAKALCNLGVDYLGLIFFQPSPRSISIEQAGDFVAFADKLVPVVVDQSLAEIQAILALTQARRIQCHGEAVRQAQIELDAAIERVFVISLQETNLPSLQVLLEDYQLNTKRDYLLIDSIQLSDDVEALLRKYAPFRCFVAGKLDIDGVKALQTADYADLIYALDMASQVETTPGVKDLAKVQQIMQMMTGTR